MSAAKKKDHPASAIYRDCRKRINERMSYAQKLQMCIDFVTDKATTQQCCHDVKANRPLRCNCLNILCGKPRAIKGVAHYMVHFFERSWEDRAATLVDWLKYSRDPDERHDSNFSVKRKFLLIPFMDIHDHCIDEDGLIATEVDGIDWKSLLRDQPVCKSAIGVLLDVGHHRWDNIQSHVKENTYPQHGNKGKTTGQEVAYKEKVEPALKEYFEEVRKFACPRSTKAVRDECGVAQNTHNENEKKIEDLPSHWSKRAVYVRWVNERGWKATCLPDGKVKLTPKDGTEQKPICVLSTFLRYWQKHYKLLRVQRPSEDICGLCHTFYHSFRRHKEEEAEPEVVQWEGEDKEEEYTRAEIMKMLLKGNPILEQVKELESKGKGDPKAILIATAELHVRQADAQRQLVNLKMEQACADFLANVPHEKRRYVLIADFSQSEQLPYFGREQPGETYYYSPLKISIFGIVDCSYKGGKLTSYVYREGEGKRGGNAVASMLMKFLKEMGWIQEGKAGGELTIVMDNCGGQNKNKMVLRLALYLMELGYFKEVSFVFLVVGHTKNACDRWFNILKQQYRTTNIYSYNQLIDVFSLPKIAVQKMQKEDFRNWDAFENVFYKTALDNGSIKNNHIFTVECNNPTLMKIRRDCLPDSPPAKLQEFVRGVKAAYSGPDRLEKLRAGPPMDNPVTLPETKQVELYEKFRPLIPKQYQDETCPYPGDEVMLRVRDKKNFKANERAKLKKEELNNKKELMKRKQATVDDSPPKRQKDSTTSSEAIPK